MAWAVGSGLWFSGSAAELKPAEAVTGEELTVLLERLYVGGLGADSGRPPAVCAGGADT